MKKTMSTIVLIFILLMVYSVHATDEFLGPFSSWLNAKTTFGAIGDGTTDDTRALQKALDSIGIAHGTLYIPAGTYKITATLEAPSAKANIPGGWEGCRIAGAHPDSVTIAWYGASGGKMFWANGATYCGYERMTFDGRNIAGDCFNLTWEGRGNANTYSAHIDNVYKNAQYGIHNHNVYNMDAEQHFERCKFLNCSNTGIYQRSSNAMNWFIWYCTFEDCGVGLQADTYRELYVYKCSFFRSKTADLKGCLSARECYSYGSQAFVRPPTSHPIDNIRSYYFNTIVNTVDPVAINDNGAWQVYLVDNVIASTATSGAAVVQPNGNVIAIGNKFTVSSPIAAAYSYQLDNTTVDRSTLDLTAPVMPGAAVNYHRKVFEAADNATGLQIAIQSAVAYQAANKGSRPVVHVSGATHTPGNVTIYANTDIQVTGDNMLNTLRYNGQTGGTLFTIRGPTRVSFQNLSIIPDIWNGEPQTDYTFDLVNCDQPGSRVFLDDAHFSPALDVTRKSVGILMDSTNYCKVVAHSYFTGHVRVIGGTDTAGTSEVNLLGSANVGWNGFDIAVGNGWPSYEVINGGKLLVQDAYAEYKGGFNEAINCHGTGVKPGQYSMEISCISTATGFLPSNAILYKLSDWSGTATFCAGMWYYNSAMYATNSANADKMNLLALGNGFPSPNPTASGAHVYIRPSTSATVSQNVPDPDQFVRNAMAFRRSVKAEPMPLTRLADNVSDIRFFRVMTNQGGSRKAVMRVRAGTIVPVRQRSGSSSFGLERSVSMIRTGSHLVFSNLAQGVTITLFDMSGKVVRTTSAGPTSKICLMSMSGLTAGTYCAVADNVLSKRVFKIVTVN